MSGSLGSVTGRRLGPFQLPLQPLAQRQTFRLVQSDHEMRPQDFHHIQDPSSRRSRIMKQILERHPQNIGMVICSGKLVQQNHLRAL